MVVVVVVVVVLSLFVLSLEASILSPASEL